MWSEEQVEWIGRMGRAAFVLLFLAGEGRPVRAREVSRRLKTDYETARRYLCELAGLGAAVRTPAGWLATPAGRRLVVSAATPERPPAEEVPGAEEPRGAKKPRLAGNSRPAESRVNAEKPSLSHAEEPRLSGKDRLNAVFPRLGEPIITINVNEDSKDSLKDPFKESFKHGESLIITIEPENAEKPLSSREKAETPRCGSAEFPPFPGQDDEGDLEGLEEPDGDDEGDSSRPAELGEALHRAGILLNPRTRPLFGSDFLTAAHVMGSEHKLKKFKGRNYQPGLLVVALEGIRPGEPPAPVGYDGRDPSRYAEWND